MNLEDIRQDVIRRAEDASNRPILVTPDPSLKMLATIRIARGQAPAHIVSYNPAVTDAIDYLICYQCGFLIRLYEAAADRRFDLGRTYWGRKDTEKLLTEQLRAAGSGVSRDIRTKIADQIYDGLILQLRSVPIGLRVDQWLISDYPRLQVQQQAAVERQLRENLQSLSPEVRKMSPPKILNANLGMNAAMAMFWSRQWSDPKLLTPYETTGHSATAEKLVEALGAIPSDPSSDRDLLDAWGKAVSLEGWYEFVPAVVS